jgi:hypothetical protein
MHAVADQTETHFCQRALADAPFARALNGGLWGAFTNARPNCATIERLYVEDAIYDRFQLLETYKKQGFDRLFKRARAAVKSDVAAVTRVYDVAEPWN